MHISNSEKNLMDVLWSDSSINTPISARQIIDRLDNEVRWHDRTVKTLLNRLLKKQAIGFQRKGREYLYYPIVLEQDYVEVAVDNFLHRVFKGSVSSLVASFAKQEKLTGKDLIELKALIAEMENKKASGSNK